MSAGPDVTALLDLLERNGVAHVVVGSVAAAAHGVPGVEPGDLDVAPDTDADNLRLLAEALTVGDAKAAIETGAWQMDEAGEFRWVEDGIERAPRPLDPEDPTTFDHSFATRYGRLDVVPRVAGSFAELRSRATRLPIAGREAWVADPADVLAGMTGRRRPKDGPRVRHLRTLVAAPSSGIGFVGFRTDRFDAMVALFRDLLGLAVIREAPGATWFRLGADAELHVYADTDPDHAFFTTGPVVGLLVDDLDATRARLEADGLEMLTEIERTETSAWCHFRAPDGTVLEIIGPAAG
jgi:catechol 2,3-dioxygenase-like lactoylglutathione lyase family enzyme